ncbi:CoA ester lyase [Sphingomonas sp. BK580]|uniref:HpcH/HpaI aldolase/citrate lyase family protein n=1 Tax=Sphingomonas sp. BK580 TaxID=2586972 RepID=UPI00160F6F6F|nr:CoA ester lyase [Sphingomonas sp. BK580]MBB3695466.1 citrate lyase subunit beta/citryl-CoA lyase [Sphingomonas sp. BK580]
MSAVAARPRRSALFLPASNQRALAKARTLDCDAVILDLEDSVAPAMKREARDAAVAGLNAGGWEARERVVRVNGADTEWGAGDLAALRGAPLDAVLLPKVDSPATLHVARAALGDGPALWAMIETCAGVVASRAIAAAARETGLAALVIGPNDLARELRCTPGEDRAPLWPILTEVVLAARLADIVALDGVTNVIDDAGAVERACAQGARWGFDGKTLIHPAQIEAANRAFAPSAEAVARAERIVAAFALPEHAASGAIRVDGEMVERLHLAEAERLIALDRAVQSRQ